MTDLQNDIIKSIEIIIEVQNRTLIMLEKIAKTLNSNQEELKGEITQNFEVLEERIQKINNFIEVLKTK